MEEELPGVNHCPKACQLAAISPTLDPARTLLIQNFDRTLNVSDLGPERCSDGSIDCQPDRI